MLIILSSLHSSLHHCDLKKQYDGQESVSNLGLSSQGYNWAATDNMAAAQLTNYVKQNE